MSKMKKNMNTEWLPSMLFKKCRKRRHNEWIRFRKTHKP